VTLRLQANRRRQTSEPASDNDNLHKKTKTTEEHEITDISGSSNFALAGGFPISTKSALSHLVPQKDYKNPIGIKFLT
jgi:hypothetical protein